MHICLAALTVHLLRIHKLFYTRYIYYDTLFYNLYSVILLSSQFTSWVDKNANKNIRYKHFAKLAHFWPSQFPSRERVKKHFAKFAHFFLSKDSFLGSQVGPEGKMEPLSLRCGAGKFTLKFAKSWAETRKSWTEKVFRKFQLSLLCCIAHGKLVLFWHNVVNAQSRKKGKLSG